VPHVNQLIDKYGKQGLTILLVTDGPDAPTEKFIEETKLKAPVVWEKPLKTMDDFGFGGYPSSVLVAANGKVVWVSSSGSGLDDKLIEEHLASVVLMPPAEKIAIEVELPKKHASIAKQFSTGKIGEGWTALTAALGSKELKEDDKTKLEAAQAEVDKLVKEEVAFAEKLQTDKRFFDAQTQWKRVSAACKGMPTGKTADEKLSEIAKDANLKKELEAGGRIAEAMKLANNGKTKPAIGILTGLGEGSLKDTEEAKRAKAMVEELKKA
jgi:AhpC/TSA family